MTCPFKEASHEEGTAVTSVYLTDGLTTLPMGLLSRVVATNDTLMALVPLLDQPPWVRRRRVSSVNGWLDGFCKRRHA
eukprot:1158266-Pelagomonas_calceolata.AAC.1